MLKIVFNDLFINLKKSWISILIYLILFYFIANFTTSIILVSTNELNSTRSTIYELLSQERILKIVIPSINVISVFILFLITKKIPLRLSKAMFVCPLSEKDKMKHMYFQLAIKIILGFIFIFLSTYILIGKAFINKGTIQNILLLLLWLFLITVFNLRVGIGEEGMRKVDKNGYIIYTKEEETINYYFFPILILEAIIFYSMDFFNINFNIFILITWIITFLLNGYIIYKNLSPIIKKALSYEDVYRQIPDEKEGF